MIMGLDYFSAIVAVICTIVPFTLLFYKENVLYRYVENLMLGSYLGYLVVGNYVRTMNMIVNPILGGNLWIVIPLAIGLCQYLVWTKKYRWLVRYPYAVLVASMFGMVLRGAPEAEVLGPLSLTAELFVATTPLEWFTAIVVALSVMLPILYFTYTRPHRGVYGSITKYGRYLMMFGFGAFYANVSMTRLSYTIATVKWLLQVIGLVPP